MARRKKNRLPKPTQVTPVVTASHNWHTTAALLLLLLVTLGVYWPALSGDFLWDDDANVTRPELQPLGGLYRIWFEPKATAQYYPFVHTVFWLEHKLWGDTTLGYHLINVLWHSLAVLLVYAILKRLGIPGALLATAVFALHPVMVESVAWITEQKNTLSTVFYLAAFLTYFQFDQSRKRVHYYSALGLFVLALFSKTATVSLPAAILVVVWWQRGTLSWHRDVRPLIPFFVVAAACGLITIWVEAYVVGARGTEFKLTLLERFLLAGRALWFYLGKLVWPRNLIFFYRRWEIDPAQWWQWFFPIAALAVTVAVWKLRTRSRAPLAAWFYFCGTLLPVLGFLNVYFFLYSFVADHFQYVASLGIIVFASASITLGLDRVPQSARTLGAGLCLLLLATYATLSWRQSRMYADSTGLYRATIKRNPECWMAYNNLGAVLLLRGEQQEAINQFQEAIRIKQDNFDAYDNLGAAFVSMGKIQQGIEHFQKALNIHPGDAGTHYNLGFALVNNGQVRQGIDHYREAIRLVPDYPNARANLGKALIQIGELPDAVQVFEDGLKRSPDDPILLNNLAFAQMQMDRYPEADEHLQHAYKVDSVNAATHLNLGLLLDHEGQTDEAVKHFEEALRIDPNEANAHRNLGVLYARAGDIEKAVAHYKEAARLRPEWLEVQRALDDLLLQSGRPGESIAHFEAALRLQPDNIQTYGKLARALAQANRSEEAVAMAEKGVTAARSAGNERAAGELEEWLQHYQIELRRDGNAKSDSEHNPAGP